MGKSTTGPELTDCAEYLRQLSEHHQVMVTVLITASTGYGGLPLSFVVVAAPAKPEEPWSDRGWSVERSWPHRQHRSFEGALYWACMELDNVLSNGRWAQAELPA